MIDFKIGDEVYYIVHLNRDVVYHGIVEGTWSHEIHVGLGEISHEMFYDIRSTDTELPRQMIPWSEVFSNYKDASLKCDTLVDWDEVTSEVK